MKANFINTLLVLLIYFVLVPIAKANEVQPTSVELTVPELKIILDEGRRYLDEVIFTSKAYPVQWKTVEFGNDSVWIPKHVYHGTFKEALYGEIKQPEDVSIRNLKYYQVEQKTKQIGKFVIGMMAVHVKNKPYLYYVVSYDEKKNIKYLYVEGAMRTIMPRNKDGLEERAEARVVYDPDLKVMQRSVTTYHIDHNAKDAVAETIEYDDAGKVTKKGEVDWDYCYFREKKTPGGCE